MNSWTWPNLAMCGCKYPQTWDQPRNQNSSYPASSTDTLANDIMILVAAATLLYHEVLIKHSLGALVIMLSDGYCYVAMQLICGLGLI